VDFFESVIMVFMLRGGGLAEPQETSDRIAGDSADVLTRHLP
jgi:hypothetical protein